MDPNTPLKPGTLVRATWPNIPVGCWYRIRKPGLGLGICETWGLGTQDDRVRSPVDIVVMLGAEESEENKNLYIKVLHPDHGVLVALIELRHGDELVAVEETVQHDPG